MQNGKRKRQYYQAVEDGKAKNDFTNAFLNHFGFCDYPPSENLRKQEQKYRRTGGVTMAGDHA